ncbi:MAG: DNA polymerase II [Pseudomonadota bacterium]
MRTPPADRGEAGVDGFILTRDWHEAQMGRNGSRLSEIVLWCASQNGPVRVVLDNQEAVCFVRRTETLPPGAQRLVARRKPLDLLTPTGEPVDGLYFTGQRSLQAARQDCELANIRLLESDVRAVDRYLMERFIRAGVRIEGPLSQRRGYLEAINPKLRPNGAAPALSRVSLDIETRGFDGELLSAGLHLERGEHLTEHVIVVSGARPADSADPRLTGLPIEPVPDEATALRALLEWFERFDPDLIIGWNVTGFDLSALERRFAVHGLPFRLGRGGQVARVLPAGSASSMPMARIPGRVALDGIECLRAAFFNFEDFRLDAVARELLGRGKLIDDDQHDRGAEIERLHRDDPAALIAYNLEDCRLVADIFKATNLVNMSVSRAQLTGLALGRLGGAVASLDNLYLPRLHRRGRVGLDIGAANSGGGSPGGHVLDSVPGIYENVLLLDFKSLYPSIIRTFQIDPLGLWAPGDTPVEGYLGASFAREGAILPELIEHLWQARDAAKQQHDGALSHAIKIIMNSFYGVLGSSGCRFYDPRLASSITRRGHEVLKRSQTWIEEAGHKVIYGDTDSLFVWLGAGADRGRAQRVGERLAADLNEWWRKTIAREHELESRLEVEFETHFSRFLMPTLRGSELGSKKRYAGLVTTNDGDSELVFKGLESVRTDWTMLAREFQRELLRRVFADEPYEAFVTETAGALLAGELDDKLVYRKRLRRNADEYERNVPPQVQAAKLAGQRHGWVRYVITLQGPQPVTALHATPDYDHYLTRQLAPVADAILQFKDTSFAALTDRQMSIF